MGFEVALFLLLALLAIGFAFGMLLTENAVHSALFLIGNFAVVAVLFLMLDAAFIGMVQIAVYAGAIMVLFLFVIMLLGAEKTEGETRRFRGLSGIITTLAFALLISLGLPLLLSGLILPQAEGAPPQVRVVHGANIVEDAGQVRDLGLMLSLTGGGLPEPQVFDLNFGDVSDFVSLPAGQYQVTLTRSDGQLAAPPSTLSFEAGKVLTLVAYGALDLNNSQFVSLGTVEHTLSPITRDTSARVQVLVDIEGGPYKLVDLGPNRVLDRRMRPQVDENGQAVLDANGQPVMFEDVDDAVLAADLNFGTLSQPFVSRAGTYWLALVDETNTVIKVLDNYEIKRDTEKTLLFVPDYEAERDADGSYRPRLLDREGATLTLPISAPSGSPRSVGQVLFIDYLLPVNLVGLLLLVALVGVVVLTRPDGEKQERRNNVRRKVSRPLISVISQQTQSDVLDENQPRLNPPTQAPSGD